MYYMITGHLFEEWQDDQFLINVKITISGHASFLAGPDSNQCWVAGPSPATGNPYDRCLYLLLGQVPAQGLRGIGN